jgi:predicted Rossmann fold nucleotide-binding protein DprA/Smf involved in DNA uptake
MYQNEDGSSQTGVSQSLEETLEMKKIMDWWSTNAKDYVPPTSSKYPKDKKKALQVQKALAAYGKPELPAEQRARELREAVQWWSSQGSQHVQDM